MNWVVIVLAAVAVGTAFGVGRGFSLQGKGPVSVNRLVRSGREGIRLLLERVEREETPDVVMGAMCYRTAAVPERAEYICPVCGGRTWYGGQAAYTLTREADSMRRAMLEINGTPYFQAFLDESAFCSICSGADSTSEPGFILDLVYSDGDTVSTAVNLSDLQMLVGFVQGELSFADSYDSLQPLKDRIQRLRVVLGVE